jgi:predicted amidohydrolase
MRIGVAQTRPVKGDIRRNIAGHKALIRLAADYGADAIIFPELSSQAINLSSPRNWRSPLMISR